MSIFQNSDPREEEFERQQKQQRKQHERQLEQQRLQQAFGAEDGQDRGIIKEILDSDDVTEGNASDLQDVTLVKIRNVLSNNLLLANFTDAQEHDKRYWLEVQKLKVIGMHPPKGGVSGYERRFLYGDEMEELRPLSEQERALIEDFFEAMKDRATRGRGGFERKQINTNIARTEREDGEEDDDGSVRGLF